jgi:hypothetical protein
LLDVEAAVSVKSSWLDPDIEESLGWSSVENSLFFILLSTTCSILSPGDIEAVATAIGNSRKLWLVVEKESVGVSGERWWWTIYWRYRGRLYPLLIRRTEGSFLAVV